LAIGAAPAAILLGGAGLVGGAVYKFFWPKWITLLIYL
jgi:hypothetical protein